MPDAYPRDMPERVTFARIAVGYEGGDRARDALALARLLARGEAEITLIRVLVRHELLEEVAPEAVQRVAKERREKLAGETRAAASELPAGAITVLADSPAAGLERATAELDAGLLVVGSSARVRAGQILAGGVALRLLHGAPFPIALPPAGFRQNEAPLRRVGVGYDGSPAAKAALELGVRLAQEHGAAIEIIAVASYEYTDPEFEVLPGGAGEGKQEDELERAVEAATRRFSAIVRVKSWVGPGDPAVILNDRARELDFLVVGSRQHGPVSGVLLGSVTSELVLSAPCPLLVTPAVNQSDVASIDE
jgi:nucleotide-binding universal stress UspA family protein